MRHPLRDQKNDGYRQNDKCVDRLGSQCVSVGRVDRRGKRGSLHSNASLWSRVNQNASLDLRHWHTPPLGSSASVVRVTALPDPRRFCCSILTYAEHGLGQLSAQRPLAWLPHTGPEDLSVESVQCGDTRGFRPQSFGNSEASIAL